MTPRREQRVSEVAEGVFATGFRNHCFPVLDMQNLLAEWYASQPMRTLLAGAWERHVRPVSAPWRQARRSLAKGTQITLRSPRALAPGIRTVRCM